MYEQDKLTQLSKRFQSKHGRKMTILHVGNIANNAYNNAALLNSLEIDSDVICYDYYHIMGCPEWEDAEFEGGLLDQNKPNWGSVSLDGYQRPNWFAQGRKQMCIDYLLAKRTGKKRIADRLWKVICIDSQVVNPANKNYNIAYIYFVEFANSL